MSPTTQGYSTAARLFHWIVALLVFGMVPAGLIMVQEDISRPLQDTLFIFHKNFGLVVFVLVIARFAYRRANPPPPLPDHMPPWQKQIAKLTHRLLYLFLLVLPIAGYIRVRAGGFPIESLDALGLPPLVPRSDALAERAKTVHYFAAIGIILVAAMHVGAALFHGLVKRDGVFSRMWPPLRG